MAGPENVTSVARMAAVRVSRPVERATPYARKPRAISAATNTTPSPLIPSGASGTNSNGGGRRVDETMTPCGIAETIWSGQLERRVDWLGRQQMTTPSGVAQGVVHPEARDVEDLRDQVSDPDHDQQAECDPYVAIHRAGPELA